METETDRLFRLLEEGISSATPESLLGETNLKVEQLADDLALYEKRDADYRLELNDVSGRIEAASLEFSELETLLARQRAFEQRISVNTSEQRRASFQLAEAQRRLAGLSENYKACLMRQRALESGMGDLTEGRYKELLEPVQQEMTDLVGAAPSPVVYQTPPEVKCCWV